MLFDSVKSTLGYDISNHAAATLPSGSSRTERNSSSFLRPSSTVVSGTGFIEGPLAYDSLNHEIYYGSWIWIRGRGPVISKVWANADGSVVKAVYTIL